MEQEYEVLSVPDTFGVIGPGIHSGTPEEIEGLRRLGAVLRVRPRVRMLTALEHKGVRYEPGDERCFDPDMVRALVASGTAEVI
jgi:hypothetical protein